MVVLSQYLVCRWMLAWLNSTVLRLIPLIQQRSTPWAITSHVFPTPVGASKSANVQTFDVLFAEQFIPRHPNAHARARICEIHTWTFDVRPSSGGGLPTDVRSPLQAVTDACRQFVPGNVSDQELFVRGGLTGDELQLGSPQQECLAEHLDERLIGLAFFGHLGHRDFECSFLNTTNGIHPRSRLRGTGNTTPSRCRDSSIT